MTTRRRLLQLAAPLTLALVAWCLGFAWFVHRIHQSYEPPPHADGIVALTGGAYRIQTALLLLEDGRATRLLVSGAGTGVDLADLAHLSGLHAAPLVGRVPLGHAATSTRGNALETAAWVGRYDIHSLIVVTAFYHMPRALTELHRVLTGVALYPLPVRPPGLTGRDGRTLALRLEVNEFTKFLIARSGFSMFSPGLAPPPGRIP
jgi:uncharacterized SAM-binding protein YcdF (DUF218 family)